jgi:hypothetical protein
MGFSKATPSPYLFIIIADVLQRLILLAWRDGLMCHPLSPDLSCPVLQYADDTLILCRANIDATHQLKNVLDNFALATGLAINFHKSCFIPMHVSDETSQAMAATLGCPISSFPQPYVGLPLSPTKLLASTYAPLILSFDRRLSGWHAMFLSSWGHLVLCNVVLNNLATYFMCSYLLPLGVLESTDKRRCAFFWTGKDSCSHARCLIAWDKVLMSKNEDGFGIKGLHQQNKCLLLKFVHKLHQPESLPWKEWYFRHSGQDLGVFSPTLSFLEKIVVVCLPLYHAMARCSIVSGTSTSFWLDKWMPGECLAACFPALFSHVTRPHVTVQVVLGSGIDL